MQNLTEQTFAVADHFRISGENLSVAGPMDTKYRHGVPNGTRKLTIMMFTGGVQGRLMAP